jgi:glutaryl-CoA dehydrogenase
MRRARIEQMTDDAPRVRDVAQLLAIDSLFSPEERDAQKLVRDFLDEQARPNIARWFEEGATPREFIKDLGTIGVFGMHLTGYGCAGVNATTYGLACLELEAVDSSLRSLVSVQGSLVMFAIASFGTEEQKAEWLPRLQSGQAVGCFALTEPDAGSDPSAMRTRARRLEGDWVIDGHKTWITSGTIADVAVVWARNDDGVQAYLVPSDTPGWEAREIDHKLSLRASPTADISLEHVVVPDSARLPGARGLGSALRCLNEARFGIIFGALGAARDCLQVTRDYAIERRQFDRAIAGFQLTQQKLADMAIGLGKGQLLAVHLGRLKEQGRLMPEMVSAGKLSNVRDAIEIARECRTILGAAGITLDFSVMRHANNLESVLTYEGTSEVHTLVVGEALTGFPAYR